MTLDTRPLSGYGIEDFCHTMTDIILYDIFYKQSGNQYTDSRVEHVQPIGFRQVELICEQMLDFLNQVFQDEGSQSRAQTHNQAEHQHNLAIGVVALNPLCNVVDDVCFASDE